MTNYSRNHGVLSLAREGANRASAVPERAKTLPLGLTLDVGRRIARLAANIACTARAGTDLSQPELANLLGRKRIVVAKQESENEQSNATIVDALKGPSLYAIGLISGVLEARAKLYPRETVYMLVPIAPAILDADESELQREAVQQNAEAISVLVNPLSTRQQKANELRESIEADTRLAAFLQSKKCA
jgi:hypothetical protein